MLLTSGLVNRFILRYVNRECAFGLSGRGRGGSRLPGTHYTQFIGHEVMRLSTYYCAREAYLPLCNRAIDGLMFS